MRKSLFPAVALLLLATAVPAVAEEEDTVTAVLKSAGAKGGEVAAKALAGLLYDTSCVNRNNDQYTGYVCAVLGSVSGRTEDRWKEDVTRQLTEINAKVDTLTVGQSEIQRSLAEMKSDVNNKFNTVAQNVVAVQHLVRIEGLWEKYQAQFDKIDQDVTREAMLSFAKEIIAEKPHTMLADLNAVLTQGIPATGGQPLVRYPLSEWRIAHTTGMGYEPKVMEAYEYAEKRFIDFRLREQKAYAMYLWAANVLETQCTLHPNQCRKPPRSTKEFKDDWNRYTQQQAAAFNSAVDWLLLSYSPYRLSSSGNFLPEKNQTLAVMQRANYVTSTMLGDGQGLWGRVTSAGNAWDGSLQVTCGGAAQTLVPVLTYAVPVAGSGAHVIGTADSGPVDWWVSTRGNAVYDEVRFSSDWKNYIYSLPSAKAGPCSVTAKSGVLPWVKPDTKVVTVTPDGGTPFPFGSFVAIQRAGGTYALVSGEWGGSTTPFRNEREGKGALVNKADHWLIERSRPGGPRIGLYRQARGEYSTDLSRLSSRVHLVNKIAVSAEKEIRFPDSTRVKLNLVPGNCERELCNDPGSNSILAYDIENNDTESKKGTLDAYAAVRFVDTSISGLDGGAGIKVDGSYGKSGDRKTLNVTGLQSSVMQLDPRKKYRLTYVIYFDLWTEGRFTNATDFWYRALLAPQALYLTKVQ